MFSKIKRTLHCETQEKIGHKSSIFHKKSPRLYSPRHSLYTSKNAHTNGGQKKSNQVKPRGD